MANQIIVDETRNQIVVVEGETRVVEVVTQGPQGPVGPRGETGPSGSSILNQITSGSVTASVDIGSAAFTITRESNNLFNVGSSGNVGIGVTNPTSKLQVSGSTILGGSTTIKNDQFNAGTYWKTVSGSNMPSLPWRGITYGNGLFVAAAQRSGNPVSVTGSIATSPDGVNWTFRTLPSLTSLINITYQNGIFIACGNVNQRVFYSYDGINWFNGIGLVGQGYSIAYGKDKFILSQIDNPNQRFRVSYDGINWQAVTTPSTMDLSWVNITYADDKYVAVAESNVSGSIAISYDGLSWNNVTRPSAGILTTYSITYGKGLFVVTCNQGKVMTSPDGVNWTVRDTPLTGLIWKCIYAEGVFIAAGAFSTTQNKFIYSIDGIIWEEATTPAINNWSGFAYGNGMLIAVSYNSTDNSAIVVKSGELNSFITQNNNITHGRQTFTNGIILSGSINITGSQNITGPLNVTGSLTVTDTITAQRLVVQTITSSISYITGSTLFGNSLTNTHIFTGSVGITGSLSLNGSPAVTGTGTAGQVAFWDTSASITSDSAFTYVSATNTLNLGIANTENAVLQIFKTGSNNAIFGFRSSDGYLMGGGGFAVWEPYNFGNASHNFNIGHASLGAYNWYAGSNATISSNTHLMRLTRGAALLINTTTDNDTDKLQVNGGVAFGTGFKWDNVNGRLGVGTNAPSVLLHSSGVDGSNTNVVRLTNTVNLGTTAWANTVSHDIQFHYTDPSFGPVVYGSIRAVGSPNSGLINGGTIDTDISFLTAGYDVGGGLTEKFRIKATGQTRFVPRASAPSNPQAGDIYYDSTLNKLRVYTTAWETITSV